MANEQIVKGKAYRILSDASSKLWSKLSFWTASSDVEFNDGKNAETKVGAIDGITDSLVSDSSNIAASAKAANDLNGMLNDINTNMGGLQFRVNSGKGEYKAVGADTWLPFKGTLTSQSISSGFRAPEDGYISGVVACAVRSSQDQYDNHYCDASASIYVNGSAVATASSSSSSVGGGSFSYRACFRAVKKNDVITMSNSTGAGGGNWGNSGYSVYYAR